MLLSARWDWLIVLAVLTITLFLIARILMAVDLFLERWPRSQAALQVLESGLMVMGVVGIGLWIAHAIQLATASVP